MRMLAALLAGAAALALGACGGKDTGGGEASSSGGPVRTVERVTTVEVLRGARDDGGFDARAVYRRDAPGVVTVFSVLPRAGADVGEEGWTASARASWSAARARS